MLIFYERTFYGVFNAFYRIKKSRIIRVISLNSFLFCGYALQDYLNNYREDVLNFDTRFVYKEPSL